MMAKSVTEDYHILDPEKSLLKPIGWMGINGYKYGGVAIFENDDYGKQIGADYIMGAPYEPQMIIHDDKGRKSVHNNPKFWMRYIKVKYSSTDQKKGTYYVYNEESANPFVYYGKFIDLKIDPNGNWSHHSENYNIIRQFNKEKEAGSFKHWDQENDFNTPKETDMENSQLTEQVSRLRSLMQINEMNEGFFSRQISPEKKAQVIQYLESGQHPNRTAAYNQYKQEDPAKAEKYVEFFALYPNGYPTWDEKNQKFVEQVPTSYLNETDDGADFGLMDKTKLSMAIMSHLSDMQERNPRESGMINFIKSMVQELKKGDREVANSELNQMFARWNRG